MAILAPAATTVAIALLALAGGFAHLGGLGQAFNGPTLPSSAARAGTASAGGPRGVGRAASTPGLGATLLLANNAGAGSSAGGAGAGAPGPGPPGAGNGGSRGGRAPGNFTGGPQPVPGGGYLTPPPSNPPPNPPPHQTVVDGVVKIGTSVTSKLPAPVGPAATQTLQSVGQTLDRILPPLPGAARTAPSGGGLHLP